MPRRSFIWKIPPKDFRKAISENTSWLAIARRYCTSQGNIKVIQARALREKLDTSHFVGKSWAKGVAQRFKTPKYTLEQLLVKDSPCTSNTRLKDRLIQEKKMQSQCYACGIDPVWNGKPLPLHLYHLNGDTKDNRIDNLTLLCPNCRSQTLMENMHARLVFIKSCNCGKDIDDDLEMCGSCKRKYRRPSRQDLEIELAAIGISGVCRKYKKDKAVIKDWLLNSP